MFRFYSALAALPPALALSDAPSYHFQTHEDAPSYHFRTYGDTRFDRAKARLVRTARNSGWFNTTAALGPSSLPAAFRRRYAAILRQPRGGGYWIWKLAVFHLALEHMADGDFLVYLDAGCELNLGGGARFRDYVAMVDASPYDVLSFELTHPEHKWTTDRVFRAFGVENRTDPIRLSRQYVGGILIMQRGPHLYRWLDLARRVLDSDPWLITDRYNREARAADPAFIEARHDQSIFSVSRKLVGSVVLPDETYPSGHPRYPFWASRRHN